MDIPAPLRQLPNQLTVARIAAVPVLYLGAALASWLGAASRKQTALEAVPAE